MLETRSNNNITYRCAYHVVWTPKYRRKVLLPPVDDRLKQIIKDTAAETNAQLIELEVMPDHVHLLIGCDPQYGIHKLIRTIKGRSSRYLREEYPHLKKRLPTLWNNSYFVATVGGAPLNIVKQYIENQKHH